VANIRETLFEATPESFRLGVVDAGGEPRELHLDVEEGGLRIVVFHRTEHALIPVHDEQARELALWLVARVGLPPAVEFRAGRLHDQGGRPYIDGPRDR
jgi:hypothetical protein